jgi:hypothetical protein
MCPNHFMVDIAAALGRWEMGGLLTAQQTATAFGQRIEAQAQQSIGRNSDPDASPANPNPVA